MLRQFRGRPLIQKTDESAECLSREMHFVPSKTISPNFDFDAIKKTLRGYTS